MKVKVNSMAPLELVTGLSFKDKNNEDMTSYLSKDSTDEIKSNPSKQEYNLIYKKDKKSKNYKAYYLNPDIVQYPDLEHKYILKLK